MKDEIKFGYVDTSNGLTSEGYMENGEMKFKKIPWYKKIFTREPSKTEFIGTTTMYSQLIWSNNKNYHRCAVYRKFNPYTNKTQCIYTNVQGNGIYYFNIDAYEKEGRLV